MEDGQGVDGLSWLSDYVLHFLKSPTWITPIASYVDERCILFDGASEENKLEYTQLHNEFKQLVDDLFVAHLLEVEVTHEQFEHFCQNGLERNPGLHHLLVEQVLSVEDFLTFKAMMCKRNADLYSEAMQRLEKIEAVGTVPEGEATAEAAASLPSAPVQYSADMYDTIVQEEELDADAADQKAGESLAQEWRLYEDQLFQAEEQRLETAVAQEEAELEQAIALSLQAEEERLRQLAAAEVAEAAALEAEAAALEAAVSVAPAVMDPPPSACMDPQPPAASPSGVVPQRKVLPKLVKVKKLKASTQLPPVAPPPGSSAGAELARRQVQALQQRERAERVSAAPAPAASEMVLDTASPPPGSALPQQPTEEERRRRAEHLRRTRELLVQKRNEERQRALGEYQAAGGMTRAAADRARAPTGGAQTGRAMADHLAGSSNSGPAVPVVDAAKEMRQALAAQLRQTLTSTVPSSAARGALGRLEELKP